MKNFAFLEIYNPSFFFFFSFCNLICRMKMKLVEKFGTRLIVSHETRVRDPWQIWIMHCLPNRIGQFVPVIIVFWATSRRWFRGEFYGFFEETREWFVAVYYISSFVRLSVECNGTIKIRFNRLIVFKKNIARKDIYFLYIIGIKLIWTRIRNTHDHLCTKLEQPNLKPILPINLIDHVTTCCNRFVQQAFPSKPLPPNSKFVVFTWRNLNLPIKVT